MVSFTFFMLSLPMLIPYFYGQELDIEVPRPTDEGLRSTLRRSRSTDEGPGLPIRERGIPLGTRLFSEGRDCGRVRSVPINFYPGNNFALFLLQTLFVPRSLHLRGSLYLWCPFSGARLLVPSIHWTPGPPLLKIIS